MTRLVHGIVSLTAEQIDLIVELLPQPLERELLEEDLSPTLRHEVEHDLERVNGILKGELLLQRPADLEQARRMVGESVRIYNTERPHQSLKMQTPDAVHRASLAG